MTKDEMEKLSEKVASGNATEQEVSQFTEEFNKLLSEVAESIKE